MLAACAHVLHEGIAGVAAARHVDAALARSQSYSAHARCVWLQHYFGARQRSNKSIRFTQCLQAISDARDKLDDINSGFPASDDDQGISKGGNLNVVPTDDNGLAYARYVAAVLDIVYLVRSPLH
jgi:hypothetical protein